MYHGVKPNHPTCINSRQNVDYYASSVMAPSAAALAEVEESFSIDQD